MNSGTECPAATIQYRLNLPYALHSISPALSSLHTSRAAALHPEISTILHPSHCPKCGTYRFSGDHPTYLAGPSTKKKRRRSTSSRTNALQRRCHLCGFSVDTRASSSFDRFSVPVQLPSDSSKKGTVPTSPRTEEISQESPPTDILRPVAGTVPTTICPPVLPLPGRQSQPKSRHSKTSTLKNMLSRDRQREEVNANKKRKEGHEGLAAFLKEL